MLGDSGQGHGDTAASHEQYLGEMGSQGGEVRGNGVRHAGSLLNSSSIKQRRREQSIDIRVQLRHEVCPKRREAIGLREEQRNAPLLSSLLSSLAMKAPRIWGSRSALSFCTQCQR